jgi:hypothetical protein
MKKKKRLESREKRLERKSENGGTLGREERFVMRREISIGKREIRK